VERVGRELELYEERAPRLGFLLVVLELRARLFDLRGELLHRLARSCDS
jgi:hypothetical protein